MSGHTPGPWAVSDGGRSNYVASVTALSTTAKVFNVAMLARPMRGDVEANARLIAAAPDLLSALQKVAWRVEEASKWLNDSTLWDTEESPVEGMTISEWIFAAADAAIAKATQA